jgi:hypothetical protein
MIPQGTEVVDAADPREVDAERHGWVSIIGVEHGLRFGLPGRADALDEPLGMGRAPRGLRVDARQELRAVRHETAQHGINESSSPACPEKPCGIDGAMNGDLGWVAGVLDLMGGDRQQCPNGCGEGPWTLEKVLDGRSEAQIPANRAE